MTVVYLLVFGVVVALLYSCIGGAIAAIVETRVTGKVRYGAEWRSLREKINVISLVIGVMSSCLVAYISGAMTVEGISWAKIAIPLLGGALIYCVVFWML